MDDTDNCNYSSRSKKRARRKPKRKQNNLSNGVDHIPDQKLITRILCHSVDTQDWQFRGIIECYTGPISTYCCGGKRSLINALTTLPPDSWLLGPRYSVSPFDAQVGLTGKCLENETFENASIREIAEEIGITISATKLVLVGGKTAVTTHGFVYECRYYSVNIESATPYDPNISQMWKKGKDDHARRVCVIMHGDYTNVYNLLSELRTVVQYEGNLTEQIDGVVAMPVGFAIHYCGPKLREGGRGSFEQIISIKK
jgi:hypothetical protein